LKRNAARQGTQPCADVAPASGLILGIDPGLSKCGWALMWPGLLRNRMLCGSWESDKDASNRERIRDMGERFLRILREYQPKAVAIESYGFQSGRGTSSQGAKTVNVLERIVTLCDERDIPVIELTPAQVKKLCRVKGKVSSEAFAAAFDGVPRVTNEHGRDAGLVAWAGWLKGVET
jgi:Holliday junction resolvasome RuvABC endonuclease subunit